MLNLTRITNQKHANYEQGKQVKPKILTARSLYSADEMGFKNLTMET